MIKWVDNILWPFRCLFGLVVAPLAPGLLVACLLAPSLGEGAAFIVLAGAVFGYGVAWFIFAPIYLSLRVVFYRSFALCLIVGAFAGAVAPMLMSLPSGIDPSSLGKAMLMFGAFGIIAAIAFWFFVESGHAPDET